MGTGGAPYNPAVIYRFSGFSFDAAGYELDREGDPVDAEPQVLEVLALLLHHRDRLVTKEELLDEVWEGRFVGDSAISRAIREVRRVLGDSAAESRFVKTVYGRGFRFVGDGVRVEETADAEPEASAPEAGAAASPVRPRPPPAPLTSMVGREREAAEILELLESARLLTVTGAAGTGKTRLAVDVAGRAADRHPDGAVFVPLADVVGGDDPAGALAGR
jgi:DNA-binding winged helix-turn-helix (wHTH) protein